MYTARWVQRGGAQLVLIRGLKPHPIEPVRPRLNSCRPSLVLLRVGGRDARCEVLCTAGACDIRCNGGRAPGCPRGDNLAEGIGELVWPLGSSELVKT